jgi:hypothetical protein
LGLVIFSARGGRWEKVSVLRAFLKGVGEKGVPNTWCFDGEFVVRCVANVVVKEHIFRVEKCANFLKFIFCVGVYDASETPSSEVGAVHAKVNQQRPSAIFCW